MPAGRLATLPGDRGHTARFHTVIRTPNLHRALRLGLLLIAVVMVSTVGTKPAMAKAKSCADQVIADWYDDGRVGKIYPLHCYTEAIAKLPPDVLDYSNAKEEIGRALAFAKQGKPDPGGSDPSPGSTATTETQATTTQPTTTTATTTAARYQALRSTAGGRFPSRTSRIIPPPKPITVASVRTPTTSTRSSSPARTAPPSAPTNTAATLIANGIASTSEAMRSA